MMYMRATTLVVRLEPWFENLVDYVKTRSSCIYLKTIGIESDIRYDIIPNFNKIHTTQLRF